VSPVLLFVNHDSAFVAQAFSAVPHAYAQFHGDESPLQCLSLSQNGVRPYLRAARIPLGDAGQGFDLVKYSHDYSHAQALLLDAHVDGFGGSGKAFNWSLLPLNVNAHLVLSGGLTAANVADGIAQVRPRCKTLAVDVSSGVEADGPGGSPLKGIKDAEKINQFVAAVRAADQHLAGL
jgi:phosphoribosylanthranilate isomerase